MRKGLSLIMSVALIATCVSFTGCGGSSSKSDSSNVAVTAVGLKASTSIIVGGTEQLAAEITPTNATNQSVTWASSDTSVATVAEGLVTAVKKGTATITVTSAADTSLTATCTVTVTDKVISVTGVSITPSAAQTIGIGSSVKLAAGITPTTATTQDVTWSSSDSTIATVSAATGSSITVSGVKTGSVTITATSTSDTTKKATVTVNVVLLYSSIDVATASGYMTAGSNTAAYNSPKTAGAYTEVTVDKLVYYANANGFQDGDSDGGIFFNYYAADTSVASTVSMNSYIGIPAASIPTTSTSVKITVKAKAYTYVDSGTSLTVTTTPKIALVLHSATAAGRVIALSSTLTTTAAEYVFDGVVPNSQIDICNGAANGQSMYVESIKVEASSTAIPDTTAPAVVSGVAAETSTTLTTQAILTWTNPTDSDFNGVVISCSDSSVASVTLAKTSATHTFTGLTASTTYTFTIKTIDSNGNLSAGVTVNATPGVVAPLLDQALSSADGTAANTAVVAAYGTEVSIAGNNLLFYGASGSSTRFKANDSKFMFNCRGINLDTTTTWAVTPVGSIPGTVNAFIAIPATYTTTSATSLKITVSATQYNTATGLNLVLMDSTNKVIAKTLIAAGASSGATAAAYVFDGVVANGEIRISGEYASYMYITNVKVEKSSTAVTYQ